MAKKRRQSRATKCNRERALNNALARQVEPAQGEAPRQQVRTKTQLEWLEARAVISTAQKESRRAAAP